MVYAKNALRKIGNNVKGFLKSFSNISKITLRKFSEDNSFTSAAFLSYVSMLALVPLLIVVLSLFSSFTSLLHQEKNMLEFLLRFLVPASAKEAVVYIKKFSERSGALSMGGVLGLVSLSYALFEASEKVFNNIWQSTRIRTLQTKILTFSNILFWLPFLLGMSFYITTRISRIPYMGSFSKLLLTPLPLFISALAFSLLYLIIPAAKVEVKAAFIGGTVAAIFWEIAKHAFDLYTKLALSFKAFTTLYGPLILFPTVMVWIYFSWLIILLGAELSYCIQYGGYTKTNSIPFMASIEVLSRIHRSFLKGEGALKEEDLFKETPMDRKVIAEAVRYLEKKGMIVNTEDGFLPAIPPEKLDLLSILKDAVPQSTEDGLGKFMDYIKNAIKGKTLRDFIGWGVEDGR